MFLLDFHIDPMDLINPILIFESEANFVVKCLLSLFKLLSQYSYFNFQVFILLFQPFKFFVDFLVFLFIDLFVVFNNELSSFDFFRQLLYFL